MWSKRTTPVVFADHVAEPEREQELDVGAREGLVHDVPAPARVRDDFGVADGVAAQEDSIPGDLDVVEDRDGVHLVEP